VVDCCSSLRFGYSFFRLRSHSFVTAAVLLVRCAVSVFGLRHNTHTTTIVTCRCCLVACRPRFREIETEQFKTYVPPPARCTFAFCTVCRRQTHPHNHHCHIVVLHMSLLLPRRLSFALMCNRYRVILNIRASTAFFVAPPDTPTKHHNIVGVRNENLFRVSLLPRMTLFFVCFPIDGLRGAVRAFAVKLSVSLGAMFYICSYMDIADRTFVHRPRRFANRCRGRCVKQPQIS
jgi:hypothetical protein